MRRTIFLALLAALLLVPSVASAQGTEDILRDCADDGILQGDYSASEMRAARNDMPAELEEYSDCGDVLSREISAKTASTKDPSSGDNSSGGGGLSDSTGGTGGTTNSGPAPAASATPSGRDPGIVIGPSTPEDFKAIDRANLEGREPVEVNGRPISPAASVGRNDLPGTVIVVLALLVAAAIAMAVPFARRRVLTRSSPS
ncbi:hypothetical protein DVA67_015510 [Solirubrobacter sp. CPCC 204708]|uniref:Uncharacterized protein n=1 Tax=Solirubrobacter deserti TaxID=2282478 RepID=A0ABT4RKP2_9ACTN|nr:hypothetical protein [Solirubrobacter deserti]MBE2317389.1 hypothetical protein [Solirubrobacter deserti]MDA0139118.1 hypothetical protein [Solirubrobacter deserti]